MKLTFNTVIIGSGIAGMTAALYLKRADIDCCILDKGAPGGQINNIPMIHNYPGFKEIAGPDLANNLFEQIRNIDVLFKYGDVLEVIEKDGLKIVKTNLEEIECKNIIIAVGRFPKRLSIENEEMYIGKGISFCALCDGTLYKGKKTLVIGGGNSAVGEALYLSNLCTEVTLIHRSEDLKADFALVEELKARENVKLILDKNIVSFFGNEDKFEGVIISDKTTKTEEKIYADGCFVYIGQVPLTYAFNNLGIMNDNGYIIVDDKKKTMQEGIYAAGDVTQKDVYQIITAASDGAIAANSIIELER